MILLRVSNFQFYNSSAHDKFFAKQEKHTNNFIPSNLLFSIEKKRAAEETSVHVTHAERCVCTNISLEAAPRDNSKSRDKEQYDGLVKDMKYAYCDKIESQCAIIE